MATSAAVHDAPTSASQLRSDLLNLMEGAGLMETRVPRDAGSLLQDMHCQLRASAQNLRRHNTSLYDLGIFGDPAGFWYGAMAKALEEGWDWANDDGCGLLYCVASDADAMALYLHESAAWPGQRMLRARAGFTGNFSCGGPYIVLLRCKIEWGRDVSVEHGYALPVATGTTLLPVISDLERAACRTVLGLLATQVPRGGVARIRRSREGVCLGEVLRIECFPTRGKRFEAGFTCAPLAETDPSHRENVFVVTPAAITDGSLVKWLNKMLQG